MDIVNKVAVITGAGSGIGQAVSIELGKRHAQAIALVDLQDGIKNTAEQIKEVSEDQVAVRCFQGDVTSDSFRKEVFAKMKDEFDVPRICVPAAGITRDALSVKIDRNSGKATIYPIENFRQVVDVNLTASIYWALEMIACIGEDRFSKGLKRWEPSELLQGSVVFMGSVSSQGNKGQLAYATTKSGLEGAASTISKESMFHGVRCSVIHPGFTKTPMVEALGEEYINEHILPYTQLRRLIHTDEIADAICFMITNSAVTGEIWADAGWHPNA